MDPHSPYDPPADLRERLSQADIRAGELGDELSRAVEQMDSTKEDIRQRIEFWENKLGSLNDELAAGEELLAKRQQEHDGMLEGLRKEYEDRKREDELIWQERLGEAEHQAEQSLIKGQALEQDLSEHRQRLAESEQLRDGLAAESGAAKEKAERMQDLARQYEEAMNGAIREKEEAELRYMQEMESKQDYYLKELERVRSSHISEMTKINHNYLQRGKALKIAELEIQRLKNKLADQASKPSVSTPRATVRHGPGVGISLPAAVEGEEDEIDQALLGLDEGD